MSLHISKTLNTHCPIRWELWKKAATLSLFGAIGLVLQACSNNNSTPNANSPPVTVPTLPVTVPNFKAATFTQPSKITNPYFPHAASTERLYAIETDEGLVTVFTEVLNDTRTVAGIEARVVRHREYLESVISEDNYAWYAQDDAGNVWYMGETVDKYEYDEQGALIEVTHEGAWEAGKDVAGKGSLANPGYLMKASPIPGDRYHHEYQEGVVEDQAEVIAINVPVTLADGSEKFCVKIRDTSVLDGAGSFSYKYYAPDIGLVLEESGDEQTLFLPVEPVSARVDLAQPTFSNPTVINNPLFPVSEIEQTLLVGHVDAAELRVVYTLLPGTTPITWNGQTIQTRTIQYVAYEDRRLVEYAIDWYAQADDGSVWYFGEDVFNYEDGELADRHGTWLVERDGPLAMIMPARPAVDNVYRVENIPARVFEEVRVTDTTVALDGPSGPITGGMTGKQLHMNATYSDKIFAPGYGEFLTQTETELEALALAVPTDALPEALPAQLDTLTTGAIGVFDAADAADWSAASTTVTGMNTAWTQFKLGQVPPRLKPLMDTALAALTRAAAEKNAVTARQAAVDVEQLGLDMQLRHRAPAAVDLDRTAAFTRQLLVDVDADEAGAVKGDVLTLGYVRDRIAHTVSAAARDAISAHIAKLTTAAEAKDLKTAATEAKLLLATLSGL